MTRSEILTEADTIINGQRSIDYGDAVINIGMVAGLWTEYLGKTVDSVDVCMMMDLLKIARVKNGKCTDDSFIDIAGYAALAGEIKARLNE